MIVGFCLISRALLFVITEAYGSEQNVLFYWQAEMERALLQGERRAELDQVEAEFEIINQLHLKLNEVENETQREKEKVPTTRRQ